MARRDAIHAQLDALAPQPTPDLDQARKVLEDFTLFRTTETDLDAKRQFVTVALIILPFCVGFSYRTGALLLYVIVGAGGLAATPATRFEPSRSMRVGHVAMDPEPASKYACGPSAVCSGATARRHDGTTAHFAFDAKFCCQPIPSPEPDTPQRGRELARRTNPACGRNARYSS